MTIYYWPIKNKISGLHDSSKFGGTKVLQDQVNQGEKGGSPDPVKHRIFKIKNQRKENEKVKDKMKS